MGGIADAHRRRALVARQPPEGQLAEATLPGEPVHDLDLAGVARHGAQEPLPPRPRLVGVPAHHERVEGERGVPEPAVAIVPVAHAPDEFGQGGGRRGHDAAGGRIGHRLQRDERPQHGLVPRALVRTLGGPRLPPCGGVADGRRHVAFLGHGLMRRVPREVEADFLARGHREFGHRGEIDAAHVRRGAQQESVGAGDSLDAARDAPHPRHDRPVVEADDQVHPHRHTAAHADDHAHEIGCAAARGHAVDEPHHTPLDLVLGLEDERPGPVAATDLLHLGRRGQEPAAVIGRAEERGETGAGVEAREAEPVDGPVAADERRRLAIADERVVLDAGCHDGLLVTIPCVVETASAHVDSPARVTACAYC